MSADELAKLNKDETDQLKTAILNAAASVTGSSTTFSTSTDIENYLRGLKGGTK
jgi:hypothetical protein